MEELALFKLHLKVKKEMSKINYDDYKDIQHIPENYKQDFYRINTTYYQYLPALINVLKPKQVVELGSAAGNSLLAMLYTLDKDSKLYSCTVPEREGEWRFLPREYKRLTKVLGDDLDLNVWPDDCDLSKTDLWFIDTDHTYYQLHQELELYDKFFKKDSLILLDDINLNEGMHKAWQEIPYPKITVSELHWSGFGIFSK